MKRSFFALFALSGLSFVFGYGLVRTIAPAPVPPATAPSAAVPVPVPTPGPGPGTVPTAGRQFTDWASLDSADTKVLVANLRSVSCPERCLWDILKGRLTRSSATNYMALARAQNFSSPQSQWQQRQQQKAQLDKQIEALMRDQLGLTPPVRSPGMLFTAEQEAAIAEARQQFPVLPVDPTNPDSIAQATSNRTARLQVLMTALPSDALRNYKLEREGYVDRIAQCLRGLQPTKAEFLAAADALDWGDACLAGGGLTPAMGTALQSTLGPTRFAELQQLQSPGCRAVLNFVQVYNLPADTEAALLGLWKEFSTLEQAEYKKRAEALLVNPQLVDRYLSNSQIHPLRKTD